MSFKSLLVAGAALSLASTAALAGERPLGEPVEKNGMEIAGVYLQSVMMEPHMAAHDNTDIHIEADVKGAEGNNNGFGKGEWIPYLDITYVITKQNSGFKKTGTLYPMVASDGPHYGDNIKMDGPGKYHVAYTLKPAAHNFLRHTDKETGVGKWWAPFTVEWDVAYTGTGAKSGY